MKALIQRVSSAKVFISNNKYSSIENGLLILLGITHNDNHSNVISLVNKIINLRIFPNQYVIIAVGTAMAINIAVIIIAVGHVQGNIHIIIIMAANVIKVAINISKIVPITDLRV